MRVGDFLDGQYHNIKLKSWKDNYIQISYSKGSSTPTIQYWDDGTFSFQTIVLTIEDLLRTDWEEIKS